ncbi:Abhydrolase domain-containing protein 4 [Thelohanellus kitauei]|uniref:Abhydrolase domain-containing protein 4 n=1 Tax=Thelohanellus kitauei TaxID=669202 RepID=A0A0C2IS12_THEKT|nr:Abhydrolase domain-containing protein 4 [Thelohanellus kitauei]
MLSEEPKDPGKSSSGWFGGYLRYITIENILHLFSLGLSPIQAVKHLVYGDGDPVEEAEEQFLRSLKNKFYRYEVNVSDCCQIWTLSSIPDSRLGDDLDPTVSYVVMIHGLLSGLAFWAMNFDDIYESGHELFAIDLPGFGRSTRIEFNEDDKETEQIFVDMIEHWRQKIGLYNMIMVGHSFGGFISTAYALRYPQYVKHLILVDPWGFPDVREELATVVESQDPNMIVVPLTNLPVWVRIVFMILMPFSPFTFLRLSGGYLGPKIINFLRPDMAQRYAHMFGEEDVTTVPNYIYQTNKFNPTGEMAFRSLSMPLAWAKSPLIKRISTMDPAVQISFVYGSRSWIDFQTGYEVKDILKDSTVNVHVIDEAGHHLFADQPSTFNSLICRIIEGEHESSHIMTDSGSLTIKDLTLTI